MDCPYCKVKMKEGKITVNDTLSWTPNGEKRQGLTKWGIAKNGILLAKYYLVSEACKEAFYCETCKIIILKVE